jgi:hypothetical protein
MEAKDWITLASVLSTGTLAIVTILMNRQRDRLQQERDDANRAAQQQREDSLRREVPHRGADVVAATGSAPAGRIRKTRH